MTNLQYDQNQTMARVAAWFAEDDNGKRFLAEAMQRHSDRRDAAAYVLQTLKDMEMFKTPDGAKFSKANIRAAMVGLDTLGVTDTRRRARAPR